MRLIVEKWILASLYAKNTDQDQRLIPESGVQHVHPDTYPKKPGDSTRTHVDEKTEPETIVIQTNLNCAANDSDEDKEADRVDDYAIEQPNIFFDKYERVRRKFSF